MRSPKAMKVHIYVARSVSGCSYSIVGILGIVLGGRGLLVLGLIKFSVKMSNTYQFCLMVCPNIDHPYISTECITQTQFSSLWSIVADKFLLHF